MSTWTHIALSISVKVSYPNPFSWQIQISHSNVIGPVWSILDVDVDVNRASWSNPYIISVMITVHVAIVRAVAWIYQSQQISPFEYLKESPTFQVRSTSSLVLPNMKAM